MLHTKKRKLEEKLTKLELKKNKYMDELKSLKLSEEENYCEDTEDDKIVLIRDKSAFGHSVTYYKYVGKIPQIMLHCEIRAIYNFFFGKKEGVKNNGLDKIMLCVENNYELQNRDILKSVELKDKLCDIRSKGVIINKKGIIDTKKIPHDAFLTIDRIDD